MFENKTLEAVKENKIFSWLGKENLKLNYNPKDFMECKEGDIIYQNDARKLIFIFAY